MSSVDKAYQTQLSNIQQKTGKNLSELAALVGSSGLTKHSQIREMLMREFNLGYGDANTLTHAVLKPEGNEASQAQDASAASVLDDIYTGAKASLRPIHDQLMKAIESFGEFEIAPKKGYVSLRRKRQFAMIGPASNTRVEVGINHKALGPDPRLIEQPPASMCNVKVRITQAEEIDDELIGWIRQAYESAG